MLHRRAAAAGKRGHQGKIADRMPTHYQVLGVHSQSELASIRAAYMTLMKRHHPDRGVTRRNMSADVYRINLAYSVLRDPAKRAQYDADLVRVRLQSMPMPGADRRLPVVIPPRKRRRAGQALLLCAIVVPLLLFATTDKKTVPARIWPAAMERASVTRPLAQAPSPAVAAAMPELDRSVIGEVVTAAAYVSLDRAIWFSVGCFENLRSHPSVAAADRCIAFDMAYSYWHEGEFSGRDLERYFQPSVALRRHEAALALVVPQDLGGRLQALQAVTFSSLTDSLAAGVESSALSTADQGNSAQAASASGGSAQ